MAAITASPVLIPPGGTSVLTVTGLTDPPDLIGTAQLISRVSGAVAGTAQVTVALPQETVGLENELTTTYFVRVPTGFTLTKTSATTFAMKHSG